MAYWPGVLAVRLQGICWDHVGHRDPNLIISEKKIYIYHIRVFFKSFGSRNPAPSNTTGKLWQEESVWLGLRRAGEFLEKSSVRQTRFFTILAFDRSGAWSS